MKKCSCFVVLFLHLCLTSGLFAQINPSTKDSLFNDSLLQEFHVYIELDTLNWLFNTENLTSDHEFKAQLLVKIGEKTDTVPDIGFRLRGNTSRFSQKKSFKIDINQFVKGRRYHGLKDINLNGEHNDPSIMRAELSWYLLQRAGVKASRTSHVKVYINDTYYGLYLSVEDIDDVFIEERFEHTNGNLYKCLWPADLTWRGENPDNYKFEQSGRRKYELKTNEELDDYTGLRDFIQFLEFSSEADFANTIENRLDVDGLLRWIAIDILTGNWDNYWHNKNNYYLYHDFNSDRFHVIPYDYDNTFGIAWDNIGWADQHPDTWTPTNESRKLITRVLDLEKYRNRLHLYLKAFLNQFYTVEHLEQYWTGRKELVQEAAESDLYRTIDYDYSINDFNRSFIEATGGHDKYGIKPFIEDRIRSLKNGQLNLNRVAPWVQIFEMNSGTVCATEQTHTNHIQCIPYLSADWLVIDDKSLINQKALLHYKSNSTYWKTDTLKSIKLSYQPENEAYFFFFLELIDIKKVEFFVEFLDSDGLKSRYPLSQDSIITFYMNSPTGLLINEFMASNTKTIADEAGEFEDWVELYNHSDSSLNLNQFSITDKPDNPLKFPLPDSVIAPFAHVLVWLDEDASQGPLHANFKISKSGEFIGLYHTQTSIPVDSLSFGPQEDDWSFGRVNDADSLWLNMRFTSPGNANFTVSVEENTEVTPETFPLISVYPNPFNPSTTIQLHLTQTETITISIFDILGRNLSVLVNNKRYTSGEHRIQWNAHSFSSGMYFIQFQSLHSNEIRKVTLLK